MLVGNGRTAGKGINIGSESIVIFSIFMYKLVNIMHAMISIFVHCTNCIPFNACCDICYIFSLFLLSNLKPDWAFLECCKFSTKIIHITKYVMYIFLGKLHVI